MGDFNTVTVPAKTEGGVKSGVTVQRDELFTVSGIGRASYNGGNTFPDGTRYQNAKYAGAYTAPDLVLPGAPVGMLIARIGSGPWLAVGSAQTFRAGDAGEITVAYNDRPGAYVDNSGEYAVMIQNHGSA
ncbi:LecA/PA-IL family lectin [Streptomyces sp. NPDC094049]|uniref:LecA/PA-IL family lectin n=1 Tax=Streptomyces sp. NPDC094049 TaxID=3154987 RepID=UPI00332BC921